VNIPGVRLDIARITELKKILQKDSKARVRVGILGPSASRKNKRGRSNLNNPTLGYYHEGLLHEVGSKSLNYPARSFLRVPLRTKLPEQIEKIGKAAWQSFILRKGLLRALDQLGMIAENVVQKAFATSGYGRWAPNAPATVAKKGSSAPLIETGQLRKAITHEVVAP